jgi:hypothetical protein
VFGVGLRRGHTTSPRVSGGRIHSLNPLIAGGEQVNLRSTILYRTIGLHWPEACRSCQGFVGLHYTSDPTGDNGLDQCACDALTLWPFASPTQQSATRRE